MNRSKNKCKWVFSPGGIESFDDDHYNTSCGRRYEYKMCWDYFIEFIVKELDDISFLRFCPGCGKKIQEV